jgi:hypothetical protein
MHYSSYIIFLLTFVLFACQSEPDAQQIIDRAIARHGGERLEQSSLSFDFRKKHYDVSMENGIFRYESLLQDDTIGTVHDVLTNEGFVRNINEQEISLSEEDNTRFMNSLNSVVYFALLPYFLNDPAANKRLLGTTTIKDQPYYEIKVTFDAQGGGTDYDDEFIYWIHQEDYTMDYLAYTFHVNGGGNRFREAYNVREMDGIRLADYINYKSTVEDFALEDYEQLFEEGKVEELSRIELENVEVN